MRYLKKIAVVIIFLLPFCFGTVGYYMENADLLDSMYGAFALYTVNPVFDCTNALVEFARWCAPLVLVSGLVLALRRAINLLKDFFRSFFPDATVVFCDNDLGGVLSKNMKHGITAGDRTIRDVNDYVIMFSEDSDNLRFYDDNKDKFKNKNVFIKSEILDSFKIGEDGIKFFNINEIIARRYWKDRDLIRYYNKDEMKIKIAIIGFGQLGQKILTYGIQNNIYSLKQSIEYHIWGDTVLYANMHKDLHLMNDDRIVYHDDTWDNNITFIAEMDRVIVTDTDAELVICLQELGCGEVDCYDPDKMIARLCKDFPVFTFGQYESVLTEENIKTDNLYSLAKKLNYKYMCIYGTSDPGDTENAEREWKKLDSFTKGSNITAADYQDIRLKIMKKFNITHIDDTVAEMEHIRWCRYNYLNHWKYGAGADGKKDNSKRLHPCLVPFSDLSRGDKDKDIELIKFLTDLSNA